jgi:hypothetical protein
MTAIADLVLPEALTTYDRWRTWRYEGEPNTKIGKRDKIPKNPHNGERGDTEREGAALWQLMGRLGREDLVAVLAAIDRR